MDVLPEASIYLNPHTEHLAVPAAPPPPTVAELEAELERVRAEAERSDAYLRDRITTLNGRLSVMTENDISNLLGYCLSSDGEIFVEAGLDGLEITVHGLTIRDGEIRTIRRDFEVSATVTFEVTVTVEADSEEDAEEMFRDALEGAMPDIDVDMSAGEFDSVYTTDPDIGYITVSEV